MYLKYKKWATKIKACKNVHLKYLFIKKRVSQEHSFFKNVQKCALQNFWTLFKNEHLRGPCSLRPCSSRPYCICKRTIQINFGKTNLVKTHQYELFGSRSADKYRRYRRTWPQNIQSLKNIKHSFSKICFIFWKLISKSIDIFLCLVHVIWKERRMTNLVLNVWFDFFSGTKIRSESSTNP